MISKSHAIVITGASSGIGNSLAKYLAKLNCSIIAVGRRAERINALAEQYQNIKPVVADVNLQQGREKIVAAVAELNKPVHIIHNAAITGVGLLKNIEEAVLRKALETNLIAPILLTQLLVPFFKESRLVNVSSGLAHYALEGTGAYCISKAGLFMFYKCINVEFKPEQLIAGTIRPGIVDTEMQQELRSSSEDKLPVKEMFQQFHHDHQLISPDRVSTMIAHMLFKATDAEFSEKEWDIDDSL